MSLRVLFTVVAYSFLLWSPSYSQYYYTSTKWRLMGKIKKLVAELVTDAEVKIAAIQHYRDQYYRSIQYQLGQMAYDMRNHYKRMVLMYQLTNRNVEYWYHNHHQNIGFMLDNYRLSMEVDNSVRMIKEWQKKRETQEMFHERMNKVMRSRSEPDHELDHEQLEKLIAGVHLSRGGAAARARVPAAAAAFERTRALAPSTGVEKKKKKWRHVNDDNFV